ncbi:MAG: DUF5333 domain-containing protein [Rhodobacter sp.]|nr:DUF5333 domain-containing protein [Rhodobacter sp.]
MIKPTATLLALFLSVGAQAAVLQPLEDNPRVRGEFLAAAVGDEIRKNCPTISARMFRVLRKANELEDYALSLGYSRDDIKEMRKSPAAKARLKALRDAYLVRNGVTKGDAESYCRLGYEEIEKNSLTGWLLRAN